MRLPTLLASVLASSLLAGSAVSAPKDWILAGSAPQDYTISLDHAAPHSGKASALLAAKGEPTKGFGTLMQMTEAGTFVGKRVRFTAQIRAQAVSDWAGLWFRVDGEKASSLAFDNMQDRPIKGDSGWTSYSIVLDVPKEAAALAFGVLLSGSGKVWIDSARFEVVDQSVATTGAPKHINPPSPTNLDFEQ